MQVSPAAGTKPGERVFLQGEPSSKDSKVDPEVDLYTPGNAWVDAKDFLTTDANCNALYNGKAIVTSAGPARYEPSLHSSCALAFCLAADDRLFVSFLGQLQIQIQRPDFLVSLGGTDNKFA